MYVGLRQVDTLRRPEDNSKKNSLINDDAGLSTVEYIIILVLIAVLAIGAWREFGESIRAETVYSAAKISAME